MGVIQCSWCSSSEDELTYRVTIDEVERRLMSSWHLYFIYKTVNFYSIYFPELRILIMHCKVEESINGKFSDFYFA